MIQEPKQPTCGTPTDIPNPSSSTASRLPQFRHAECFRDGDYLLGTALVTLVSAKSYLG